MIYNRLSLILLLLLLVLLAPIDAKSENIPKKEQLQKLFQTDKKHNYNQYLKNSNNELEATAAILFLGYKSFLSSQDMNSCVFTPSCSVYAIQALQHDHPVEAYFKIFDRLTRCHPLTAKGEYPIQKNTNLYYDPAY
jgi:putative membrane protein insertion efficiency factor